MTDKPVICKCEQPVPGRIIRTTDELPLREYKECDYCGGRIYV